MSTPQTLTQVLPPHQYLDHRQRYLPSPQDRYLPPPRPSSNLSNSFQGQIPTRPPSNVSAQQFQPPPPRTQSGMSNGYTQHGYSQARAGAEYAYANGYTQQPAVNEELRRTGSRTSQYQRQLPPPEPVQSRAPAVATAQMPPNDDAARSTSAERSRKRREKAPVDWVEYFGGKPPTEIITIHDDDSPGPTAQAQRPPPQTSGTSTTQPLDKRRRVNGGETSHYSTTNTPYSYSNGTSTESLQNTTAPTSLGSQVSSSSRLDGAQTGQKRKRPSTRTAESERKKQETERSGPRGYLAEYGDYIPPVKSSRKQKDVVVPAIHDVWVTIAMTMLRIMTDFLSLCSVTKQTRRSTMRTVTTSCMRTAG